MPKKIVQFRLTPFSSVQYQTMLGPDEFAALYVLAGCVFTICVALLVKACFDKQRGRAIFLAALSAFVLMLAMVWLVASLRTDVRWRGRATQSQNKGTA